MPKQWKAEDYINYFDPNKSIFNKGIYLFSKFKFYMIDLESQQEM